jgi:hypothetical protein
MLFILGLSEKNNIWALLAILYDLKEKLKSYFKFLEVINDLEKNYDG